LNGPQIRHLAILFVGLLVNVALGAADALADQPPSNAASPLDATSATPHFADSADHVHVVAAARDTTDTDKLVVTLRIDPGFHINANPASFENLIPTSLMFAGVKPLRVVYPKATRFKPKFLSEALDVYQGTVAIAAYLPKGTFSRSVPLGITVTAQACTDVICLPPATLPVPYNQ
jgi:uncharacterized protein